jgi:hypothetical protein
MESIACDVLVVGSGTAKLTTSVDDPLDDDRTCIQQFRQQELCATARVGLAGHVGRAFDLMS